MNRTQAIELMNKALDNDYPVQLKVNGEYYEVEQ